jgi:hypothetical protein
MRCSCCDRAMTDKEIKWNKELNDWELCTTCLEVAMDAAYSDGHSYDDTDLLFVPLVDDTFDEGLSLTAHNDGELI